MTAGIHYFLYVIPVELRERDDRLRLALAHVLFKPRDVVPSAELPAGVMPDTSGLEAEPVLHADALRVRHGHAAVKMAQSLHLEQVDEAGEQHRAGAVTVRALLEVDGKLRVPVIRRALADTVRIGAADDLAVLFADEIGKLRGSLADAHGKLLVRRHIILERDGRVRDVRCVDRAECRAVLDLRSANGKLAHGYRSLQG